MKRYKDENDGYYTADDISLVPAGCIEIPEDEYLLANPPQIISPITEVSKRQASAALIKSGAALVPPVDLLAQLEAALLTIPGIEGELARSDWSNTTVIHRDYPLILAMQSLLGWSDAQMDKLFTLASTL